MTSTVDLTPTWIQVLELVKQGLVPLSELKQACIVADIVMKAEKEGRPSITFTFKDGEAFYEDGS